MLHALLALLLCSGWAVQLSDAQAINLTGIDTRTRRTRPAEPSSDLPVDDVESRNAAASFIGIMTPSAIIKVKRKYAANTTEGADVMLDGSGSSAIWGTMLVEYVWDIRNLNNNAEDTRVAAGRKVEVQLPPGKWEVKLTVRDDAGNMGSDARPAADGHKPEMGQVADAVRARLHCVLRAARQLWQGRVLWLVVRVRAAR